jgi:hypothetical protein
MRVVECARVCDVTYVCWVAGECSAKVCPFGCTGLGTGNVRVQSKSKDAVAQVRSKLKSFFIDWSGLKMVAAVGLRQAGPRHTNWRQRMAFSVGSRGKLLEIRVNIQLYCGGAPLTLGAVERHVFLSRFF